MMTGGCGCCAGFGQLQLRLTWTRSPSKPRLVLGPQRLHRQDLLAARRATRGRIDAVVLHLLDVPADPDAEAGSARRSACRARRSVLARAIGIALGDEADAGGQLEPFRRRARRGERDERVERALYSSGSSGPPGHGDRRLTGMCVCSGNHNDSKPRSSTRGRQAFGPDRQIGGEHEDAKLHHRSLPDNPPGLRRSNPSAATTCRSGAGRPQPFGASIRVLDSDAVRWSRWLL